MNNSYYRVCVGDVSTLTSLNYRGEDYSGPNWWDVEVVSTDWGDEPIKKPFYTITIVLRIYKTKKETEITPKEQTKNQITEWVIGVQIKKTATNKVRDDRGNMVSM